MTDFLDQLEHDLHEAAARRGHGRSLRRPIRAAAAVSLLAAIVASGIWAIDRGAERERVADRAIMPTAIDKRTPITVFGDLNRKPFAHELARLGYRNVSVPSRREAEVVDYSTSTSVFYRPGAATTAADIARRLKLRVTPKPFTENDDRLIFGPAPPSHAADVLVLLGPNALSAEVALSDCRPAGHVGAGPLSLCEIESYGGTAVVVKTGEEYDVLPVSSTLPLPTDDGSMDVSYTWAAAAPDGDEILLQLQWNCHGACSNSREAFISSDGWRRTRPVGGDARHTNDTIALGWTTDSRAMVLVTGDRRCRGARSGGLYLVPRDGARTFVGCTEGSKPPRSLQPSINPRSARTVEMAVR